MDGFMAGPFATTEKFAINRTPRPAMIEGLIEI
jgi:hypothetical protein